MAVIHQTTMVPSKLELLAQWLPEQDWYVSAPTGLSLAKVGGFRLDDPAGEVGIEFMIVRNDAAREQTAYLVPMTYRGGPMPDGDAALIGTSEHGVLGRRWIYDGTADPVLLAALTDLIRGRARAQAQGQSDTPDTTVHIVPAAAEGQQLAISFARLLVPWDAAPPAGMTQVTALWTATTGVLVRSAVAAARPLVK